MAPPLHRLLRDLATNRATKRAYRKNRAGWLDAHGHELEPELVAEALAHVVPRLPVESQERLAPVMVAFSAIAVETAPVDPQAGLDALAALRPVGGGSGGRGGLPGGLIGWLIGLVVAAVAAAVLWQVVDGGGEPAAAPPLSTSTLATSRSEQPVEPSAPPSTPASTVPPAGTEPPVSTDPAPPALDLTGVWELAIVVTSAGNCEIEDPPYNATVAVEHKEDGSLIVVGLGDGDDAWSGSLDGTRLEFSGSRAEDGGITTARFELEVADDGRAVEGAEFWDWHRRYEDGTELTCGPGLSTVTGSRSG